MASITTAGCVPVISITADCLPQAWEKAVLAVWDNGLEVKTQYDKPDDPPSKDATVIVTITNPFAEPRIHKNFPGGPAELETYRQEVVDGIHDHWVDVAAGKWTYTYHQRLFAYCSMENPRGGASEKIDQIQYIIDALSEVSHTRRAQAITWMPSVDTETGHPPCLQRIWCRLIDCDGTMSLNMNTHWRSRDLYKAWFMNVYALTDLQRIIAGKISAKINRQVTVGRYVDISDSLHIYGSYFKDAGKEVEKMRQSPFGGRAWQSTHPAFEMMTKEAREKLAKDPDSSRLAR
ncbi:MAG: thymidylate synthase [Phycisphaerae bacterium]|nr:thymidylate synthase [Phycisphaerae bacterium]MDD5380053.1 thymidylate synthase [Phycisphaerae bacterium]